MFKYVLNKNIFATKEDYKEAKEAIKDKVLTIEELEIQINANIINLYNSIVSHFFGGEPIDHENIYKRDVVHEYINEFCPQYQRFFPILLQNGLIGVCGRGYTLDSKRLKQTKEEYDIMINTMFRKGFVF